MHTYHFFNINNMYFLNTIQIKFTVTDQTGKICCIGMMRNLSSLFVIKTIHSDNRKQIQL